MMSVRRVVSSATAIAAIALLPLSPLSAQGMGAPEAGYDAPPPGYDGDVARSQRDDDQSLNDSRSEQQGADQRYAAPSDQEMPPPPDYRDAPPAYGYDQNDDGPAPRVNPDTPMPARPNYGASQQPNDGMPPSASYADQQDFAADACADAASQEARDRGYAARVEGIDVVRPENGEWRVEGHMSMRRGARTFACGIRQDRVRYVQLGG
jgi:hypothetical protein